jgi:hypothetical protein
MSVARYRFRVANAAETTGAWAEIVYENRPFQSAPSRPS